MFDLVIAPRRSAKPASETRLTTALARQGETFPIDGNSNRFRGRDSNPHRQTVSIIRKMYSRRDPVVSLSVANRTPMAQLSLPIKIPRISTTVRPRKQKLERAAGVEPAWTAWKAIAQGRYAKPAKSVTGTTRQPGLFHLHRRIHDTVSTDLAAYARTVLTVRIGQPAHGFFLPCPQNGNPCMSQQNARSRRPRNTTAWLL